MKKLIFTLCAVFCAVMFSFEASAQDQEILRLKNGTEITGIIERLPDGGVRVTNADGDTFVFTADEIALITNAEQKAIDQKKNSGGYFGLIEIGGGYGFDWGGPLASVSMVNGYRFSPWFYLGFGVGFAYGLPGTGMAIPIFLHARYSILGGRPGNKVSPFISFSAGYDVFSWFMLEPSLGVEIKTKKKSSWWIALDAPMYLDCDLYIGVKAGWSF